MAENVIDVLTRDHDEAKELVDQLLAAPEPERRRELADTLIGELVRHSVAEEALVYPIMRVRLPDGERAVEHDIEEHKQLEQVMKGMEDCDVAGPDFLALVGRLQSLLLDHANDEETEQFPQLREHVDDEQLRAMGGAVAALKKVAPTRPHPNAPNSALFHLTVGPGVGLVDRLRDLLTTKTHTGADSR